jgi:hypothetical protein
VQGELEKVQKNQNKKKSGRRTTADLDSRTTMGTFDSHLLNLPYETQLIASFLLKYVEKCIVDANCLEDHEFDEDYGDPFLIEHEESRQFKKNLTGFLRAHITDGTMTLEEKMQKAIDGCNDPELTLARNNFSHLEDEQGGAESYTKSNGCVPTFTIDYGTVGQGSEMLVVNSQQSDTNDPMPRKSPDDDGTQDHSSEPPRKRHRSEGDGTAEPEDLLDSFPDSGRRQTLDSLWTPEMRLEIKDGYRRYLESCVDTPSEDIDAEEEQEQFMRHCFKIARVIIVSAPSHNDFPERRLNILATIFSNHPRLEIFSLF